MNKSLKKAFDNPDFLHSREARSLRILSEYLEPEKRFKDLDIYHTVIFFGSARSGPGNEHYSAAEDMAFKLAELSKEIYAEANEKFYICTGGGPGIMEAANRGAARAESPTIGLNISLPFEQHPNPYITEELNFEFHYFFMRKLWFLYQAKAIIVFPGGFGTLDELFETLTLIQTRKLDKVNIPVLLYDKTFWEGLIDFKKLVKMELISPEDLDIFHYFSTPDEGISILKPKLKEIMKNVHNYLDMKFPI